MRRLFPLLVLLAIAAPAANAQIPVVDYVGFGWETGGIPPSDPGDVFMFTAVATDVDPVVGADLGSDEVTVYVYGLSSTGQIIDGFGNVVVAYVGGTLEVWKDETPDADWGTFPPNATSPSTFVGDELIFSGDFIDFVLVLSPSGSGAYEGHLDGTGGSLINGSCTDCGYTWGGAFTTDAGAQIPDGYHVQIDGTLEVDEAVPGGSSGWGALKALYGG